MVAIRKGIDSALGTSEYQSKICVLMIMSKIWDNKRKKFYLITLTVKLKISVQSFIQFRNFINKMYNFSKRFLFPNHLFAKSVVDLSKIGLPVFFRHWAALPVKHVIIVGKVVFPSCLQSGLGGINKEDKNRNFL